MDHLTLEELWEMGLTRDLTYQDLEKLGLTRKGKWQYTVEDIEALPEWIHAELIDGELFIDGMEINPPE